MYKPVNCAVLRLFDVANIRKLTAFKLTQYEKAKQKTSLLILIR